LDSENFRESWDINKAESERAAALDFGKDTYELIGVADFVARRNRYVFTVRVPKDFGNKELV
jgi:hypothetical protein